MILGKLLIQDCTFFTRKDIIRLYRRFYSLNPQKVPTNMQGNRTSIVTLSYEEVEKMAELKVPSQMRDKQTHDCRRIHSVDGYATYSQRMAEEIWPLIPSSICSLLFLRWLLSHSNSSTPSGYTVTTEECIHLPYWAHSDFDGDEYLGHDDLSKMIRSLTRDELSDEEVEFIIERVCYFI